MNIQKLLTINTIALFGFLGLIAIASQVQPKVNGSFAIEAGK